MVPVDAALLLDRSHIMVSVCNPDSHLHANVGLPACQYRALRLCQAAGQPVTPRGVGRQDNGSQFLMKAHRGKHTGPPIG